MSNASNVKMTARGAGFGSDALRVAVATGLVLLAPLAAMQFTREVNWSALDFAVAAVLLLAAGLACVRGARRLRSARARLALVALVLLATAALWLELAAGVFFALGS